MRQLKLSIHDAILRCVQSHTDTPDKFILWGAFSLIGAVLKNKVFIKDGLFTFYPNQYIILVSPPGIGKGTTINLISDIIRDTAPNFIVNVIPDRSTAPRIIERISTGWNSSIPQIVNNQVVIGNAQDHTCLIISTELQVLLSASDWMLPFLCDTWDRHDYEYDTKNKGTYTVKNMCNSFLGGTVPNFLQNINKNINLPITGGFTSRCLFIYADTPARYLPFPPPLESNPQSVSIMQAVKNDLRHVSSNIAGEFTYNTEARIKFEDFLKNCRNNNDMDSESVAYFKSRVRTHTLKLAMILSVARKDSLVIEGIDMDNAIAYIKPVLKDVEKIFRGSGESPDDVALSKVLTYLEKVGLANRKELLRHLGRHMTYETLERVLYTLEIMEYCKPVTRGKITYYEHINQNGRVKP